MDIYEKFKIIEHRFKQLDEEIRRENRQLHFDTKDGIWGPSSTLDVFEFLMKIKLGERSHFLDFGSGDGRIVMIAALFTKASGIESEHSLTERAIRIKDELRKSIPELATCAFK